MKRLLCLLVVIGLLLSGCSRMEPGEEQVHLNLESSYLRDFSVDGDLVEVRCHVCVENPTSEEVKILLIGTFDEDQEAGLLKERRLVGVLAEMPEEMVITIPPGCTKIDVNFYGTFDGLAMKQNRLLPELELITIQPAPPISETAPGQ